MSTSVRVTRRRRLGPWRLGVGLLAVAELVVLFLVVRWLGFWPTAGLLVLGFVVGGWLIMREGTRAWRALRTAERAGRVPSREVADGALVLLGGLLILVPGLITDVLGFLLVLPFTRPAARRLLEGSLRRRMQTWQAVSGMPPGAFQRPPRGSRPASDDVIEGEIIREEGPTQRLD